jgi:hypothetical protein
MYDRADEMDSAPHRGRASAVAKVSVPVEIAARKQYKLRFKYKLVQQEPHNRQSKYYLLGFVIILLHFLHFVNTNYILIVTYPR